MLTPTPVCALRSRVIATPDGVVDGVVRVEHGTITSIYTGDPTAHDASHVHDLGDQWLLPGLIDTHVHVNEPGRADWEGWHTASRAAAAGGVTTIVDMPLNSSPVTIDHQALDAKIDAAATASIVDCACWLGVVPASEHLLTSDLIDRAPGAKAFMCDSGLDAFGMADADVIEHACTLLAAAGKPLLVHAELVTDAPAWVGADTSHAAWAATRPPRFEHDAVRVLAAIAARTGAHIHVVHVASADTPQIGRDALAAAGGGGRLTFETCPHYLTFAAEDVPDGAVAFKCAPPIQPARERERLWEWVMRDDVMIVSDHSPAPPDRKHVGDGNVRRAWGGIASLQLTLPVLLTGLAARGLTVDPIRIADMLSRQPARLAGLDDRGSIVVGRAADLIAVDPTAHWTVRGAELEHRWPLTPYENMELTGRVTATWLRGRCIYSHAAGTDAFAHADPAWARVLNSAR